MLKTKNPAGSGRMLRLALAGVLTAGSLAGIGPGTGRAAAEAANAAAASVTENVYAGGIQSGLVSWVDIARSSQQSQGQVIPKLTDLSSPFDWMASGAVTYDAAALNFNPAYAGYGYFQVPAASGFKNKITDTVEVFSVQRVQATASKGYPWELGGGYSAAGARYLPSSLSTYFGSSQTRTVDLKQRDLTQGTLLNMHSMPGEWAASLNGEQVTLDNTNTVDFVSQVPSSGAYYFGAAHNQVLDGSVSEMIVFNRKLADQERQKVNSYLALKYGMTLTGSNLENVDYIASDGSSMWDAGDNAGYGHRITGIGRDALSGLEQKQSKSQDKDALVTLALGVEVAPSNKDNANAITNEQSFLTFGDNGKAASYTGTVTDTQAGTFPVMERTFKVEKTDWVDRVVTLDLDLAQTASASQQYYLVASANETFAGAKFYPADKDGKISLDSSELADGSYFTFARVDKTALTTGAAAIDNELSGGTLKPEDYTPDSWNDLQNKRIAASAVLSDVNASQSAVDRALKELSDSRQALKPQGAAFDQAVLEKGTSGSRIAITLDRGVTFDGQVPAGFTVRVGGAEVVVPAANIKVDPQNPKRVWIDLPADLDLSNVDTVGVAYDSATGSLKGLNGGPVGSFNEPAHSGFGAALTIAQPDTVTGVVYGGEPSFGGMTEPGTESLDVVVRDAQGQIVTGAGGAAVIDPSTGAWNLASKQSLPPGTYTVEVTAKKNGQVAVKTRTFTVVDKTALQQRRDAIVGENLNGSAYTPSTWNELQGALDEAAQVLGDKTATQARIDAALNRLNAARSALTVLSVNPPFQPSVPSPTPVPAAPNKQIISVDVAAGSEGLTDLTRVELERTTNADGSLSDQVTFTPVKAQEAIGKALAKNDPTARILIPDPTDAIGEVNVNLPQATIALLTRSGVNLEIHNPNGTIVVPASSLEGVSGDLYFRLVPIKQPQQRQQVENRAVTEQVVRELSGNKAATVASRPMTIETNLSSRPVTLVLPLDAAKLPENAAQRADFLRELGVYIEHSDGTKEVVRGEVVTMDAAAGGKLGLRFGIQKFSTFTIVHLAEAAHHDAYIQGYTDGTLRPDQGVIRAEMAAMLSRLGQLQAASGTQAAAFSDLRSGYWAGDYVGQVTTAGWMKGYTDGSFKPDGAITREEMASIAFNYLGLKAGSATGGFPDVRANGWSGGLIAAVQSEGLMSGYPDGTFRPQQALTRAEAVTILNRLFDRGPLHGAEGATWPDVSAAHWAYGDLMEASLDHDYAKRSGGGEDWVAAD
ncbi:MULTISPECIES: S-layer homology domain-containing protein [Saccharibacillus]|uniref:S-layer homology domain-containing protein n=1 Tax=Saccharibacillus TaxID=456492 RepID=UPI0013663B7E|nr:S-layer homology domain-containing protein [Saccharibacillus sp. WB 17]